MERKRKGTNRYWSKDEKLRIVKSVTEDGLSTVEYRIQLGLP